MARSNFPVYFSMRRMLTPLRDDQLGRVFRAAMDFGELGLDPEHLDQAEQVAYEAMRDAIRRDGEKYDAKCRRMQENAAKGKTKSASKSCKSSATATATSTPTTTSTAAATVPQSAGCPATGRAMPLLPPDTPEGFFAENFTRMTPHYKREMNALRKQGCTDELLRCAMQDALDHDVPKWCYVRQILERCAAQGILTAEAYKASRSAMGGGHNVRVDRAQPSGNDFLRNALERPRRLKRDAPSVPGGLLSPRSASECVTLGN